MFTVLEQIERELPELLKNENEWHSLHITYDHPHVERLWRQWGNFRISLHRIHPCKYGQALYHPHPWPQVTRVLLGEYEMGIGSSRGTKKPPIACTTVVKRGFAYEMTHPNGWHFVRPLKGPAISIMVTGVPWKRESPRSATPLPPLSPETKHELLELFRALYPTREQLDYLQSLVDPCP